MTKKKTWLHALALSALAACAGSASTTSTASQSSESALEAAHDTTDAPELANVLTQLSGGPRDEGVEAWRCDPNPTITTTTVCGQAFPASIHFAWTACALPRGERANPHPCGGPPPLADGGLPPPPDDMGPPPPLPDGGMPPPPDGDGDHRGPPPLGDGGVPADAPTSSGTVDITTAVTSDDCSAGVFTFAESATFTLDRTGPRGGTEHVQGTSSSTSSHALGATTFTKATQLDVSRSVAAPDGSTDAMEVSGNVSVAFDDQDGTPVRTVNGNLTLTSDEGDATATLTDVVRDPPRVCRTPVGGSIAYAGADGTAYTLAFGPGCGAATLDGSSIAIEGPGPGGASGGERRGTPPGAP